MPVTLFQWRVFHRSMVSIAYPAFMRKERKNKSIIFAQILISNNNYCTTVMTFLVFQILLQVYNHPAIISTARRLSCRSIPALAESLFHPQPSRPRFQPMMVAICNSLNCFYFPLEQTHVQFAEVEF